MSVSAVVTLVVSEVISVAAVSNLVFNTLFLLSLFKTLVSVRAVVSILASLVSIAVIAVFRTAFLLSLFTIHSLDKPSVFKWVNKVLRVSISNCSNASSAIRDRIISRKRFPPIYKAPTLRTSTFVMPLLLVFIILI